jgi:hypothetical protein
LTHHSGDKGKDRESHQDQLLPHPVAGVPAGEDEVGKGWRWYAARSLDDRLWQRHLRRQSARSCQPADDSGGRRQRDAETRAARPLRAETRWRTCSCPCWTAWEWSPSVSATATGSWTG